MNQVSVIKGVKSIAQTVAPFVWIQGGKVRPRPGTVISDLGNGSFSAKTFGNWGVPKETILKLEDGTLRLAKN